MTLVIGVLLAVILVSNQIISHYQENSVKEITKSQDASTDEDSAAEVSFIQAVDAISSSVQMSLTHVFYFINEILLSDGSENITGYFEGPYLETYLNTIFRQIISPNAP